MYEFAYTGFEQLYIGVQWGAAPLTAAGPVPPTDGFLLQEDGFHILQENGFRIKIQL